MSPQDDVTQKLNELHTALLGIPGTESKGFIGDVKALLKEHGDRIGKAEDYIQEQKGAGRVIHILWTGFVSATTAIAVKMMGK